MEKNVVVTLYKLQHIFPPGFFNSMAHLPIHMVYKAKLGGLIQWRWMIHLKGKLLLFVYIIFKNIMVII